MASVEEKKGVENPFPFWLVVVFTVGAGCVMDVLSPGSGGLCGGIAFVLSFWSWILGEAGVSDPERWHP